MAKLQGLLILSACLLCCYAADWPDCSPTADGHYPHNGTAGPFGAVVKYTVMFQDHPIVIIYPNDTTSAPYPAVAFMHGSTGQIEMYEKNLINYASHGFVVAFPYVKVQLPQFCSTRSHTGCETQRQ